MIKSPRLKDGFRHTRFIVLAVCVLFLAFVQASIFAFNTAYVVMADRTTSPLYEEYVKSIGNQSEAPLSVSVDVAEQVDFDWAPPELPLGKRRYTFSAVYKSIAFACSFAGNLIGTFPMLYLLKHVGLRMTMFFIGAVCSVLCALTPQAISASFALFVALRFIAGFVSAPLLPLIGAIIEDWGAMEENGLFISCLTANDEIAMLFSLPVGALMAEQISWPATFYVHGLICAFFTITLFVVYRDDPASHFLVSIDEAKRINHGKHRGVDKTANPSFRSVLTSRGVWAVFIAAIGTCFVVPFIGTFSPQYFTSVLGYSATLSGTLTIIPTIALLPVKFITGVVSDRLTSISEVSKMRLFNAFSSFGAAAVFILAIFVRPAANAAIATALILIPFVLFGFVVGGLHKSLLMISREHAAFVYSLMHTFDMCSFLASSFFIPLITPDNTFDQWKIVFGIFVAVLTLSNVIFTIFVKAEPEVWAQPRTTSPAEASMNV